MYCISNCQLIKIRCFTRLFYSDITKQESVKDLILIRLIRTDEFKFLTNWITGKTYNINVVFIFQCTVKYVANNKRARPPASLKRRTCTLTVRIFPILRIYKSTNQNNCNNDPYQSNIVKTTFYRYC